MMHSIRARLLLGTIAGTLAIVVGAGSELYATTRSSLRHAFDDTLVARARALASLVEYDDGRLEFEIDNRTLPEFSRSERPDYFEIREPDGRVLARSPSLAGMDLPLPQNASGDVTTYSALLPDGRSGRASCITIIPQGSPKSGGQPVRIIAAKETAGLERQLAALTRAILMVALLTVALVALTLIAVVRRGLAPLNRLSDQIGSLDADDLSNRIDMPSAPKEVRPVVDVCNQLLARLETVVARERSFTSDVAHELRTPLAGLRSTLEVTLGRPRDAATYRATLSDCLHIATQMQGMTSNLLALARLERDQLSIHREPVLLDEVLAECWKPAAAKIQEKEVRVDWTIADGLMVETDRDMLRQVLANCLENAAIYVNAGGEIRVSAEQARGGLELRISNTGSRISRGDAPHVFERFWRGDASRNGNGLHVGLGLCLARRLMTALGGRIDASSELGGVFEIAIRLPAALLHEPVAVLLNT
jgi:heavy metal sensor kinase